MEILSTKNVKLFDSTTFNRQIVPALVGRIIASMEKNGFMATNPIVVIKRGKRLIIVDGHHRFEAAKRLGIEVCYIVLTGMDAEQWIGGIGSITKPWSMMDYVRFYADLRIDDYVTLYDYCERTKIAVGAAASLFLGNSDRGGRRGRVADLRAGMFEIKDTELPKMVAEVVVCIRKSCGYIPRGSLVAAISAVCLVREFSVRQFCKRVSDNPGLMIQHGNKPQNIAQIEFVYNYRSKSGKVPLAHLASEVLSKRRPGATRSPHDRFSADSNG